ncbi:potassium channel subfamily K member 5 [Triplophysa rosa]|uniref:Potassium channel subfamily K member 5 n=1 Tax=Triplophysa rosa TaxID=992332 RepID=A0A9W7T5U4_TRIRA|nr:potassium channel subfamily K member 5 [Triplophysa rosa]
MGSGVDPNADYPTLYRYFVEVWIYLGLAWLSLFFNWKVRMVVEAHKALKKRRKKRRLSLYELQCIKESHKTLTLQPAPKNVNIFSFLSKKKQGYNDLIKQIGVENREDLCVTIKSTKSKATNRSKSCSDDSHINGNVIINLERSPRQKRRYSFNDRVTVALSKSKSYIFGPEECFLMNDMHEGDLNTGIDTMYENQLDKEAEYDHKDLGPRSCSGSRITWDSKGYPNLMFPRANITFIDEENFLNNNLDDNDTMPRCSDVDENMESETDCKEPCSESCSETSVFTTDESNQGHSYEQLVEEYSKEENTDF